MSNVRAVLTRVARLEAAPRSPFDLSCGSLAAFEDEVRAEVSAGRLDGIDLLAEDGNSGVLACIRR